LQYQYTIDMLASNGDITYRTFEGKTVVYDKTQDHRPGQQQLKTDAKSVPQKICECSEIIKHTFVELKRGKHREWLSKLTLINIRNLTGLLDHRGWVSNSWLYPSLYAAGFKDIFISPIYDLRYPVVMFNLHWFRNIPKPICELIIEFMGFETNDDNCAVCKEPINTRGVAKHRATKKHRTRLNSPQVPKYLKTYYQNLLN